MSYLIKMSCTPPADRPVLTHQVSGGAGWADLQHGIVETSGEEMFFGRRLDGGWGLGGSVVMRRAQAVLGKVALARNGLYLTARPSAGLNHESKLSWPVAKHGQSGNIEPSATDCLPEERQGAPLAQRLNRFP
jgi:hypothetical protein